MDSDIAQYFTENGVALSSLKAGYGVFYKGTGIQRGVLLHRFVTKAKPGDVVDHINRNIFDSRRCNLRLTTLSGNQRNTAPRSQTGFKGVVPHRGGFAVYANHAGTTKNLGCYRFPEIAARVWDAAMIEAGHTEYLNFPDSVHPYDPPVGSRHNGLRKGFKFKGVRDFGKRFESQVRFESKQYWLGSFKSAEEAARAYDGFLRSRGVPEWKLNFPMEHPEKGRKAAAARKRR